MRDYLLNVSKLVRVVRRSPRVSLVIAGILFVAVAALTGAGSRPGAITALAIGDGTKIPDQKTFSTNASLEQGKTLRMQLRYNPDQVEKLSVRILKPDQKEVLRTGDYSLNDHGEFSLAMSTAVLEPGDYTVEILENGKHRVGHGNLNIKPKSEAKDQNG